MVKSIAICYSTEIVIKLLNLISLILVFGATGCQSQLTADPNEVGVSKRLSGDVLLRNINDLMRMLDQREMSGELAPSERNEILQSRIKILLKGVEVSKVNPKESWQFAEAYRLAGDWQTALKLCEIAKKAATTTDRKVNDALKLARVQAHLGMLDESFANCESTFSVEPTEKAPILLAVLYEITPEAENKKKDKELAVLIEKAIEQHQLTIVNQNTEAGKAFLLARPAHVRNGWIKIARLYQSQGMVKEAREAIEKGEADRQKTARF